LLGTAHDAKLLSLQKNGPAKVNAVLNKYYGMYV
jgi:hypothetical protein